MDVTGHMFVIQKNWRKTARRFYDEAEIDQAMSLAGDYALRSAEDFLLVQVVADIPAGNSPSTTVIGKYFLIQKHQHHKKGKIARRRFFAAERLDDASALAARLAEMNRLDYLVVQIVAEASSPAEPDAPLDRGVQ